MSIVISMTKVDSASKLQRYIRLNAEMKKLQKCCEKEHAEEKKTYVEWVSAWHAKYEEESEVNDFDEDIFDANMERWRVEHPKPDNPRDGISVEEKNKLSKLQEEIDEFENCFNKNTRIELDDKPYWLCEYIRKNHTMIDIDFPSACCVLTYIDMEQLADKLKRVNSYESAVEEFPMRNNNWYSERVNNWQHYFYKAKHAIPKLLKMMKRNEVVFYEEL